MGESAKVSTKKPEVKSKESAPKTQEAECPRSMNSHYDRMLFLQKSIGNQAVQRLFKSGRIQARLQTSRPGDAHEREADRLAEQVMQMAEPQVQRQAEEEEKEPIQTKPVAGQITPLVQRQQEEEKEPLQPSSESATPLVRRQEEEEETLQAKDGPSQSSDVPSDVVTHIDSARGGGQPLPESARAHFEPRFGRDLSQVRVHSDSRAATTSRRLDARALTHGRDIFFGAGKYQPETTSGKYLLAHELTHVVQQGKAPASTSSDLTRPASRLSTDSVNRVQRQPEAPGPATKAPAKPTDEVAPGVMELKNKAQVEPNDSIATWLSARESKRGKANVRFGKIAEGTIEVERSGDKYRLKKKQAIPLSHPIFSRIGKAGSPLTPSLVLYTQNDKIFGYVGLGASAKNRSALVAQLQKAPDIVGLAGFDFGKRLPITNKLEGGKLRLGLAGVPITLGGVFTGSITLEADDEEITNFEGSANVNVSRLASVKMEMNRSEDGLVTGKVAANVQLPKNFTGSVDVLWDGQAITGEGTVGYQGEKLSGELTLKVMEAAEAQKLETTKKAPPKEGSAAPAPGKTPGKRGKQKLVVFGEGNLTFSFTDWLNGTAHVIVDPKGFVTIIGKIAPQKEFELFPQKDYNKKLFKLEARASYGIPVVGNIFIFANIGMDAFAKLGPAKFYKMVVEGTYSTDPDKCKDFSIQGSLNISAAAGLRLRGEAGAGLEILGHDIKAGAGINAIAGIRGYAEATPKIGYREKPAAEGVDKKGEFFIRGDLEIAAQPFLGLNGDLFVEIDAPWWSPCPDKRWTWPLGGKEWPIGGSFGAKASVDYVFGSAQAPAIELQPVDFSADKFLTDLYSDKAKSGGGKGKEKPGKWKEKNTKDAAPPKAAAKGDAKVGKPPELPPAKPKVKPGGPKRAVKPAPPNARTAEGKTVKELEKEAAKKGRKPEAKSPKKGTVKEEGTESGKRIEKGTISDFRVEESFSMAGEGHKLLATQTKGKFKVTVATNPKDLKTALRNSLKELDQSSRSGKEKREYSTLLQQFLSAANDIVHEVENERNEIEKGVKYDRKSVERALEQEVRRKLAKLANQLEPFAKDAGIKSLDDFYAAPPSERYIPGHPNQTEVGTFIRKRLYDILGWSTIRAQVVSDEEQRVKDRVKKVQEDGDQNAWTHLEKTGLVEPNASIENYDPEDVRYAVDHKEPIAKRWSERGGRNSSDDVRHRQMSERKNLQLVTLKWNSLKGSEAEGKRAAYTPHVGLGFMSQYADGGIRGALEIHGQPFVDASGEPIKKK